jgi:hypothetical protein
LQTEEPPSTAFHPAEEKPKNIMFVRVCEKERERDKSGKKNEEKTFYPDVV